MLTKIDPEILEKVVVGGDLSQLTPQQRLSYYAARCEAAGLDPRAHPFRYLSLQGRLVLYADKTCADQLCAQHKLTVEIVSRGTVGDCYEVHARVKRQDGTAVDNLGVVPLAGKRGDDLANAVMKAATKAIRRATLAACGLGMLDDTEIETIQNAQRVPIADVHAAVPDAPLAPVPPVPALPPPQPTPIAEVLQQIQSAQQTPALDEIRERLNQGPKRGRAEAAQIRDALKARSGQIAAAAGAKVWSQQIQEAQDSPTLDQIRGDLVASNLSEDQKRALMGEITHRRAALGKVGLGNYDD